MSSAGNRGPVLSESGPVHSGKAEHTRSRPLWFCRRAGREDGHTRGQVEDTPQRREELGLTENRNLIRGSQRYFVLLVMDMH